jgi:hypothetical protein
VSVGLFIQLRHEGRGLLQRDGETFLYFVHNIREAFEVLQLPVYEEEVVASTVGGLNDIQKSRFVFQLKSFRDPQTVAVHR